MFYQGDYLEDATVYIYMNSFTSDDPSASSTITDFLNTDVHIHKNADLTQRNNAAGITVSLNFDGITGNHQVAIDTSDDTVGGFWVTGADYGVRVEGATIDGATINSWIGHFSIENRFKEVDLTHIMGTILTEGGAGRLKAAFVKLFDVATPLLVASEVMRGTDGANTTVPDAAGTAAPLHAATDALIAALENLSAVDVKAEVVDVINTDTSGEPGQGAPPVTASLRTKLDYLYKLTVNKEDNDGSVVQKYDFAGAVVDHKASAADVGGTSTRGKWETGP